MPNKEWLLIDCPHCTSTLLINTVDGSFENLGIKESEEEFEEPIEEETELPMVEETPSGTQSRPIGYTPVAKEDCINRPNDHNGVTYIQGEEFDTDDGRRVKITTPRSGFNSGIRSETVLTTPKNKGRDAAKKFGVGAAMVQPGAVNHQKPKRINPTGAVSSDELRFEGEHPSQDFTGLTGQEAHMDNLMQEAYEQDLAGYGF